MDNYDTLGKCQHSFCEKKSCFTNSLGFFEGVAKDLHKGNPVDFDKII